MLKQKFKASFLHLLLSILFVGFVIAIILFLFFPILYLGISDFKEITIILISVDLILGPLLTFVVYQKNKKTLKFDLSVIAAIQITALLYGAYALFQAHPLYITFNVDRFTIISAKDAEPQESIHEEYMISKFRTAKLAYAEIPSDPEERNEFTLSSAMGHGDLEEREEYYKPYKKNIKEITNKGINKESILLAGKADKNISNFLNKHKELDTLVFLPLTNNDKDAIIVLDKKSGEPIAVIDSDPWSIK